MDGLNEGKRAGDPRVSATRDVGVVIEAALIKPDVLDVPFGSWTLDRLVASLREVKGVPVPLKRSRLSEIVRHDRAALAHAGGVVRGAGRPRRR